MSFQKCPVCNGSGVVDYYTVSVGTYYNYDNTCSVCHGKKIINEETGEPPCQIQKRLSEDNISIIEDFDF